MTANDIYQLEPRSVSKDINCLHGYGCNHIHEIPK
jgi:hypothetical protein